MIYRKMYIEGALTIVLWNALRLAQSLGRRLLVRQATELGTGMVAVRREILPIMWWMLVLQLLMCLAIGIFGNWMYLKKIEKSISREEGMTQDEREDWRKEKTGVNKNAVWVLAIITVVLAA